MSNHRSRQSPREGRRARLLARNSLRPKEILAESGTSALSVPGIKGTERRSYAANLKWSRALAGHMCSGSATTARGTPPTFPQGQPAPGRMPPAQNAPPRGLSNHEAAQQIQQGWKAEPSLRDSSIAVQVNEAKVVLSGTLQNEQQRDRALRIARSYAGEREVVYKLKLQQGT